MDKLERYRAIVRKVIEDYAEPQDVAHNLLF